MLTTTKTTKPVFALCLLLMTYKTTEQILDDVLYDELFQSFILRFKDSDLLEEYIHLAIPREAEAKYLIGKLSRVGYLIEKQLEDPEYFVGQRTWEPDDEEWNYSEEYQKLEKIAKILNF